MLTTDPKDPELNSNSEGQNKKYLVLSEDERAKGFIRPVRRTYVHIGYKVELEKGIVKPLTEEEKVRYKNENYAAYLEYPKNPNSAVVGKFLHKKELDNINRGGMTGCQVATTMAQALAETYARDPKFYGATFCVGCNTHLPVNEFKWDDGSVLGS